MSLKPELVRGIHEYCLPPPTAAQKGAMQYILQGRDCVIQVKTHVNESCVYLIPMLQAVSPPLHPLIKSDVIDAQIDTSASQIQALIIASTREIAQAIWKTVRAIAKYLGVYCLVLPNSNSTRKYQANIPLPGSLVW
jgi:superfamily II DNA/RNA helicase